MSATACGLLLLSGWGVGCALSILWVRHKGQQLEALARVERGHNARRARGEL